MRFVLWARVMAVPLTKEGPLRRSTRSCSCALVLTLWAAAAFAQAPAPQPTSPLSIHIGDSDITLGGFLDATAVTRSTATGNGIGTSFGTFPFDNTPQGHLSENKLSTQNSRITLEATSKVGDAKLKGYIETDFLGNAPNGLNVTSNSNTLRLRLYWVQFQAGKFEFLAGQTWSLLTPNRNGLSPMPGDISYTQDFDTNYQVGLTWTRATEYRFVVHASKLVTAGVALENPEQYVGSAVTLPGNIPSFQVDQGTVTTNVPNVYPDIIGKLALDPRTGKTHQHIDVAVVHRGFKTYDPTTDTTSTASGNGGEVSAVLEAVPGVRFVGNAFFSSGGGRYIAYTNLPDFIVGPDGSVSLVNARSFIVGPEITIKNTLLFGYYSEARADQNVTLDAAGKPIGFGIPGANAANEKIQEPTVGLIQTFFRDPKIGGMQLFIQFSQVKRTPFSVPAGTPASATTNMLYVNVRYLLP